MLHKIQHARSGSVLQGARPGWLKCWKFHVNLIFSIIHLSDEAYV